MGPEVRRCGGVGGSIKELLCNWICCIYLIVVKKRVVIQETEYIYVSIGNICILPTGTYHKEIST